MSAVSDFALKLMPKKTGLFAPDYTRTVKNPTATEFLKKDEKVNHDKVVIGTLMQMMNLMKKNEESTWSSLATPPILMIHGQYDKAADPINAINFYEKIKSEDKEFLWMPNMWNYLFLE